jgi:hypothetical protein
MHEWAIYLDGKDGTGDTVVQNGTRHAWRNKGTVPCRMVNIRHVIVVGKKVSEKV